MLQDMAFGRLENEFRNITAVPTDTVLCFQEGQVLLRREADDTLTLPTLSQIADTETAALPRYLFRMHERNFFLWTDAVPVSAAGFAFEPVRMLRQLQSKEICYAVMTGWHLYNWYRTNRLCGCCGTPTEHDTKERMLRCPSCGNMIFPRISPAVIVAVTNGNKLLLSKYAGRAYTRYALLAGYAEIGETIEQTVHREVMEEVGLSVEDAYYAVHRKQLQEQMLRTAAQQVTEAIASGAGRPRENGLNRQAPAVTGFDYRNATKQQREDLKRNIRQAAAQGKKLFPGR